MPEPSASEVPGGHPPVRRRALLGAGAGALTLSGCRLRVGSPPHHGPAAPAPSPSSSTDDQALTRALAQAQALIAGYAQAAAVRPDLATPLGRLAADHAAHAQALRQLVVSPSTPATPSPPAGGAVPPVTAVTATSVLSQSERAAAAQAQTDLVAVGGQPARLLASLAACRSAHVAVLARLPQAPLPPTRSSS
jgi:hypothetical protein